MRAPPSESGARQARSIRDVPRDVAVRPVGAPGAAALVVAKATLEYAPLPWELIAATR